MGGGKPIKVEFRLIAATNADLEESGRGRTFPRGSVLPAQRHPDQAAAAAGAQGRHPAARRVLPDPLQRALQEAGAGHHRAGDGDAAALLVAGKHPRAREPDRTAGRGHRQGLPVGRRSAARPADRPPAPEGERSGSLFDEATNAFERNFILKALEKSGWSVSATADYLGIPLSTLKYKMDRLEVGSLARRLRGA